MWINLYNGTCSYFTYMSGRLRNLVFFHKINTMTIVNSFSEVKIDWKKKTKDQIVAFLVYATGT